MRYQDREVAVAGCRTNADALGARDGDRFVAALQLVARRLLFSTVAVSDGDRQFLHDVARSSEQRYRMVALQRLIAIARHSVRPEDREALAELVRAESLVGMPVVHDVAVAFDLETAAQGEADVAQRAYERCPSCATRERAIEKLTLHGYGIRASIDAVQAARLRS